MPVKITEVNIERDELGEAYGKDIVRYEITVTYRITDAPITPKQCADLLAYVLGNEIMEEPCD